MIAVGWLYVAIICSFTFRAMAALGAPSLDLAIAIERAIAIDGLVVHGERETRALAVAVAYRESTFRNNVTGDHGHAVCAFQIYDGSRELLSDVDACARRGLEMLRESARMDPQNPVAFYARGKNFRSEEARRISRDRVAIAKWLVAHVPEDP